MDFKRMFTAGPLSDPQPPSTLLPAGAVTVDLTLRAATPTLCKYSVGKDLPFDQMTPFDTAAPSVSPRTIVRGLDADPGRVNDVYIRSAAATSAALHLQYRSLPASKPGFPRTANLWGSWRFLSFSRELGDTDHGQDWIDDVSLKEHGEEIYRRDFHNGLVLLNGTRRRQTIDLGEGYARIKGDQAPRCQYILDDGGNPGFKTTGAWREIPLGTKEWHAIPPYFHAWNNRCHTLDSDTGEASWDLDLRGPGIYTIQAWWTAAPGAKEWSHQAVYEVMAAGKIVSSKTLDQTLSGDQWHTLDIFSRAQRE